MSNEAYVEPDYRTLFEQTTSLYMVLDPNLRVVAASDAYLQATLTRREDIIGRHVFEVFSDNPDNPSADAAVPKALASFNRVLQTRKPDVQGLQRHDVRRPESEGGESEVRYWSAVNSPVLNPEGSLAYILHRVENVTEFVLLKQQGIENADLTDVLRDRAVRVEADLYCRSREIAESSLKLKQENEELARLYWDTRRQSEARLHQQISTLTGINRIVMEAVKGGTDEAWGTTCLEVAEEVTGSKFGFIGMLSPEGRLDIMAISDPGWAACPPKCLDVQGIYGRVLRDGKGFFTNDPSSDPERIGLPAGHPSLQAFLGVPLIHKGLTIGLMAVGNREGGYSETELEALESLTPAVVDGFLQKKARESLRESEERHRSIFENSLDGVILSFPDGRIIAANPEACRMHGYTEAEICRMGRDGIADKSDPRLSKLLEDRTRTGRHRGEVTHVRRDGTKFPCETSSVVFKDKHGQEASVLIIRDVTERKRAEEALRESERRARRASEVNRTMAELGRIIGSTLRIERVYEQFAAVVKRIVSFDRIMIGLIDGQQQTFTVAYVSGIMIEGRQVGDVLPLTGVIGDVFRKRSGTLLHLKSEQELAERYPLLLPAFRAGTKSIMAAPLISKDQVIGTIQFSSLTPGAYTEEDLILAGNVAGQISGAIANAQLFAKYERSEEALRSSRDELELRVQKRTAELARKNEELQNFTFAASHDLQEPLRKIQTLSDFISTRYFDSVSEQGRDYLKRMHETATRMRDVLQSLLDYSRLTRTTHPFGRVDLNKIAREAVSDFEHLIRETGASVEIENLPEIEGDAAQMRQLFQNLIGNGLKFRREGIQPLVKIYAACSSSKGEWEICISDNGIGFDEKYLDLIFKPFQRLHGKNEFGGNGMGLAICAKVIEHHKGFITARSVPGEGSTFIVTLPVARTNAMNKPE